MSSALESQPTSDRRRWVYLSIVVLALLSWGFAFLAPDSKYWDDWVFANSDTLRLTRELGLPWTGYYWNAGWALGSWSFKTLVIVATMVIGIAAYEISGKGLGLSRAERWLLALLVVALPLVGMRMVAVISHYSASLVLFMIAWYLLVRRRPGSGGLVGRIIAVVLLFVSYTTASLLLFTVVPLLHLFYISYDRRRGFWRNVLRFAATYWYVIAAPVLFWLARTIFLTPYGLYEGYNSFFPPGGGHLVYVAVFAFVVGLVVIVGAFVYWVRTREKGGWVRQFVLMAVLTIIAGLLSSFLYVARVSHSAVAVVLPIALLLAVVVLAVVTVRIAVTRGRETVESASADQGVIPLLAFGLALVIVAMLPYMAVNKLPSYSAWETRHQLLMPFGVATIFVATFRAVRPLVPRLALRIVAVVLLGVFVVSSLSISLALVADWRKQAQLISELAASGEVRDAHLVVFEDQTLQLNYDSRDHSFYEYTGWLLTAFGNQRRLALDRSGVASYLAGGLDSANYAATRYGYGQYVPTKRAVLVKITAVPGASEWTLLLGQKSVQITVTPVQDIASLK